MQPLKISIPLPDCTVNTNNLSESNSPLHLNSAGSPTRNKIDYTKFKTKTCRNYRLGLPCPFEDRCAFAHGEEHATEILSPVSTNHSHSSRFTNSFGAVSSPLQKQTPAFVNNNSISNQSKESFDSASASSNQEVPPPPSYKESVAPPAYPKRFRNDPYSFTGPIYIK